MTEAETLEALAAIGLRGDATSTGHADFRRVFIIDAEGITHGRLTIFRGQYSHAKWYVEKVSSGRVLDNERLPWAWRLWLERRERLDVARWNVLVQQALTLARADRAEKQAWRDAHPKKGSRPRLELRTRYYIGQLLAEELPA